MDEGLKRTPKGRKYPKTNIVGRFIRERRESVGLSQRALGLKFNPPVTTQFISNVERGVTPLPPTHVPTLTKALKVSEAELLSLLEREYVAKLSGRMGSGEVPISGGRAQIAVETADYSFFRQVYEAYLQADEKTRLAFAAVCESLLKVSRQNDDPEKGPTENRGVIFISPESKPIEE